MQLLDFGNRFLNYKAIIRVINNHTQKVEYQGMFMEAPYRLLKFTDVVRVAIDVNDDVLVVHITSNSTMFFNTQPHFIEAG